MYPVTQSIFVTLEDGRRELATFDRIQADAGSVIDTVLETEGYPARVLLRMRDGTEHTVSLRDMFSSGIRRVESGPQVPLFVPFQVTRGRHTDFSERRVMVFDSSDNSALGFVGGHEITFLGLVRPLASDEEAGIHLFELRELKEKYVPRPAAIELLEKNCGYNKRAIERHFDLLSLKRESIRVDNQTPLLKNLKRLGVVPAKTTMVYLVNTRHFDSICTSETSWEGGVH